MTVPATAAPSAATNTITLTIDGELVSAHPGARLLDVIREAGVDLPTLCEFPGLGSVGACRLCLVELAGRPRPIAACVAQAEEGMVVTTNSEKLRNYRKTTVELLLAERNHVCAVCVMNGHCELQSLAAATGVDHVEYDYIYPSDLKVDISHARFGIDQNRCILCTRCVRTCAEIEGAQTWGLTGRGASTRLITDMALPWGEAITCTSCGKCVQACPTGALFTKGATVAEMVKHRERLRFLTTARRDKVWLLEVAEDQKEAAR